MLLNLRLAPGTFFLLCLQRGHDLLHLCVRLLLLLGILAGKPRTVVLDALDECTQRQELMDVLETVAGWQLDNMHLLMTSRKERDIESSVESYVEEEDTVCLQRDVVDRDIQRYVQQRLSDDKKLAKWNKDAAVRQEIEDALMQGARGMYACFPRFHRAKADDCVGSDGLCVSSTH